MLLWAGGALMAAGVAAGIVAWKRRRTPEERERERRLKINSRGRIAEGALLELNHGQGRRVVLYEYSVAQVTYNAAQDISALPQVRLVPPCEGLPARIKYDPQDPGNSIVVCEKWSGL